MPAAYYENLDVQPKKAWPGSLNLQGVQDFDPNDPLYYIIEHCGAEPRTKQLRWVSDTSVNLEFYSPEDAAAALLLLTHEALEVCTHLPCKIVGEQSRTRRSPIAC
jgi:hypothetical protein